MLVILLLALTSFSVAEWQLSQLDQVIYPAHDTSTVEVAALDNSILFGVKGNLAADFSTFNPTYGIVDIYDPTSGSWTARNLSFGSSSLEEANNDHFALFGGGWSSGRYRSFTFLDLYDAQQNTWTSYDLNPDNNQDPREGFSLAIVNNVGIIAGGYDSNYGGPYGYYGVYEDRVDLLNLETKQWIGSASLSSARAGISTATVGNKAYFAGGFSQIPSDVLGVFNVTWYSIVDVYDHISNSWSTIDLPHNATNLKSAVVDSWIAFIGGQTVGGAQNNYVQLYDTSSNTWEIQSVPQTQEPYLAATSIQGFFIFARSSGLDILSLAKDTNGNRAWSFINFISGNRSQIGADSASGAAYFASVGFKVEVLTYSSSTGTSTDSSSSSTSTETTQSSTSTDTTPSSTSTETTDDTNQPSTTGSNPAPSALDFCLNKPTGFYCRSLHGGFYYCLEGEFFSQSTLYACPRGTVCNCTLTPNTDRCDDTQGSPCVFPKQVYSQDAIKGEGEHDGTASASAKMLPSALIFGIACAFLLHYLEILYM